jgi:hypothetical protein
MFYDAFMSIFNAQEQESEMVRQVAAIGHNVETALLAEVRSVLNSSVDFANRTEGQLRSSLAFFYVPVRNFVQAKGVVQYTDLTGTAPYVLEAGRPMVSKSGVLFYTTQAQFVNPQQSYILPVSQGRSQSASGVYQEFIQVSAPGADIDTVSLVINGSVIPKVSFNGLVAANAYAAQGTPVSPTNGYFAVFYNDTLYIKVYPGQDVPPFIGQTFSMSFFACDGPSGNIAYNSMSSLLSSPVDGNGLGVSYTLINDPITGGLGSPLKSELLATLLYWLFTKNNVSAVSDFQRWFLKYPGVLDVSVNGDFEDYAATGLLNVTGRVRVAPVMYSTGSTYGRAPNPTELSTMEAELAKVRDAGITQYLTYGITYHRMTVKYISVQNEQSFQAAVASAITNLYDVNYASANSFSLFTDMDLKTITDFVPFTLDPVGLEILADFFMLVPIFGQSVISVPSFYGSKVRPGSVTYVLTADGSTTSTTYTERSNGVANQYEIIGIPGSDPVGLHIYPSTGTAESMVINPATPFTGRLEITGTPRNRTHFSSGDRNSIRQLAGWGSIPTSSDPAVVAQYLPSPGNVLFVKYNP